MIAILHNIRGQHNVGSIFRTSDAVGVEKIYLSGITPSPVDLFNEPRPKIKKVALGAENFVPWERAGNIYSLIKKLKRDGYKIFAIEQGKKSISCFEARIPKDTKAVLIVGNEVKGLPPAIVRRAHKVIEIPMGGGKMLREVTHPKNKPEERRKESLNVAVAFGVVAYSVVFGS